MRESTWRMKGVPIQRVPSYVPSLRQLTTDEVLLVFSRELFESLALSLGDQQGRENTRQHEQGKDLKTKIAGTVGITGDGRRRG